jgi:transglutaminase-like putative cysteine protease
MSRTTLCVITAAALAVLSLGTMAARWCLLGDEVRRPVGPGTWKVTLAVQGTSEGQARVFTATPLDLERQRVIDDSYHSDALQNKPPEARHPERRRVVWSQRPGTPNEAFTGRSEFLISLHKNRIVGGSRAGAALYAPPAQGDHLGDEPFIETRSDRVSEQARELTAEFNGSTSQLDVAQALFHFVEERIRNDVRLESHAASALSCLETGKGDRAGKARLLAALLRNRNVPARIVTGVTLGKGPEQQPHYWVEAFVYDHWIPMDPYHRLFGKVPSTYVVFGFGDRPVVTSKRVADLRCAFLVERVGKDGAAGDEEPAWKRSLKGLSLYQLPPSDRRLVEVLLLMPIAALVVCVFRNLIGLGSFGTFTPALIGLAFHDLHSWPGILVFLSILLVGWVMRRFLDSYHLLQVPRVALMLTLIMSVLIALIVTCNQYGSTPTRYVSLFPLVILTGMVERFWTLETEDSTTASFKTLLQTMFIALVIAVILSRPLLVKHLFCFPETLGLVMAAQLLIGRYTGYRLTELFRFRDFLKAPPPGYVTT